MLNWIVWNGTVFWHWNCVLMLNWTDFNWTVYVYKNGFGIKITYSGWYVIKPNQIPPVMGK